MKVIVVTGGIGSGKSEVCRILKDMGFCAQYNADMRAKALYDEHPALLSDIEDALKCGLRDETGRFQPRMLAEKIFSDRRSLEIVEAHLFPVMMNDFESFANSSGEDVVVFESATILEKPQFEGFADKVILVDAPFETRLDRASRRDGAGREAVLARMNNQKLMNALSDGYTDPRIDAVIQNDSTIEELENNTRKIINSLIL